VSKKVRLIASLVSFEPAYFGFNVSSEKPITAWTHLQNNNEAADRVAALLDALIDFKKPLPVGAFEWNDLATLQAQLPAESA
jgi:putative ATP-dependent endonuclease of OLD family